MKSNPAPVVLITGAARRIGAAIAQHLHQQGFNIAAHYHQSAEAAQALCAALNRNRENSAICLAANLQHTAGLNELVSQAAAHWGRLDALTNNASTFYPTPVGQIHEQDWDTLLGPNLKAPLFLSQAASPYLKSHHGCIINIIDIHAERPMRKHTVYSVAKAGLASLTRALARELAPEIRVNGVAPGAILWPENEMTDANKQNILDRIALQRPGQPQDIAEAVAFLIGASYITGQVLAVDGGRSLYM